MIPSMKHAVAALLLVPALLPATAARAQESTEDRAATDTLRAVEVSAVDVRPAFVDAAEVARAVEAHYPAALKEGGVGGKPVVRFLVDVLGRPRLPRLQESSGNAELDSAAVRVVAASRLTPARWAGDPYPVWLDLPVSFVSPNAPSDTVKAELPRPPTGGTEEVPTLSNRNDVARAIARQYPTGMRDANIQGSVTVRIRIDSRGIPNTYRIDRASRPEFVVPAAQVVQAMRFRPARVNGAPVAVWVTVPIAFRLAAPRGEPAPPGWPSNRPPGAGGRRP